MIAHGKDIKIFAGNSNRVLAQEICQHLNTKLGDSEVGKFADGECYASLYESVRGSDVFVIQSTCNPVNDNLMEMLVMIDALKRASAGRITAVIPYFGYARQDRKAKARDPGNVSINCEQRGKTGRFCHTGAASTVLPHSVAARPPSVRASLSRAFTVRPFRDCSALYTPSATTAPGATLLRTSA